MSKCTADNGKLSDHLKEVTCPAFSIKALLQGAMALLDEAEALDTQCGDIWAARQLVETAWVKVDEIIGDSQFSLLNRLSAIDENLP